MPLCLPQPATALEGIIFRCEWARTRRYTADNTKRRSTPPLQWGRRKEGRGVHHTHVHEPTTDNRFHPPSSSSSPFGVKVSNCDWGKLTCDVIASMTIISSRKLSLVSSSFALSNLSSLKASFRVAISPRSFLPCFSFHCSRRPSDQCLAIILNRSLGSGGGGGEGAMKPSQKSWFRSDLEFPDEN